MLADELGGRSHDALGAPMVVLFAATWFLPRRTNAGEAARRPWRPKVPSIARELRKTCAVASVAVTTAYTHGVLMLSLGAQVAYDLIGSGDAFINGAALWLFAIASGVVGTVAKPLHYGGRSSRAHSLLLPGWLFSPWQSAA